MSVGQSIRFLHLQKTGGSTLSIILRRQYFHRPTFYLGEPEDEVRLTGCLSRRQLPPALFLGHKGFCVGIKEVDQALKITLLREPTKRILSLCQHVHEGKKCYMLSAFPPGSFHLDRFLGSKIPALAEELSNFQTRRLIPQTAYSFETLLAEEAPESIVDIAFQTLLTQVTTFGLTEYFDASLMLFAEALNWRLPPVYFRQNQGDLDNPLVYEQRHLDRIAEMNFLDLMLYERAKQYFLKVLNDTQVEQKKLKQFRKINQAYQKVMQVVPPAEKCPYPVNLAVKAIR